MTSPTSGAATRVERARQWLLAGAITIAPLLLLGAVPFEVSTGDTDSGAESLAIIAADRGQFYGSGLALAIGLAMLGLAGIAVMQLTRARGGVLGTIGGSLLLVCCTAAAAGIFMYSAVSHAMTAPGLDRAAMAELDEVASESIATGVPFFLGFFGIAIGLLLCGIALWRARTVPLYVALTVAAAGPITFFGDSGWVLAVCLTPLLALAGVAAELVRRPARTIVLPGVPAQPGAGQVADAGVPSATAPAP